MGNLHLLVEQFFGLIDKIEKGTIYFKQGVKVQASDFVQDDVVVPEQKQINVVHGYNYIYEPSIIADKTLVLNVKGGEDHYVKITRLPYNDILLYNVLVIDAYRTPTSQIMDEEEVRRQFGINVISML